MKRIATLCEPLAPFRVTVSRVGLPLFQSRKIMLASLMLGLAFGFGSFRVHAAEAGEVSEDQLWDSSQEFPLGKILADPDTNIGKTFRFYGSIGQVVFGDHTKHFTFQELYQPKSKRNGESEGWDEYFRQTQGGPSVTVHFDSWYQLKSQTTDGKKEIRRLANLQNAIANPLLGSKFFMLATVMQYSDTFQPYLSLVSIRSPNELSPQTNPTLATPNVQTAEPSDYGASKNSKFAELEGKFKDAKFFPERSVLLKATFDSSWDTLVQLLVKQKEKIATQDKGNGIITTEVTKHGSLGFQNYKQYLVLLEPQDDGNTKMTFKILRYYMDLDDQNKSVIRKEPNETYLQKQNSKFIQNLEKNLPLLAPANK